MARTGRPPASAVIASAGAYSTYGSDGTPFNQDAAIESGQAVDLGNGQLMVGLPAPVTRNGVPAKSGMGAEAQALISDNLTVAQQFGYKNTPGTFYNPDNIFADNIEETDRTRPARILEAPTWTSNIHRPRTIAAGYDLQQEKLTIVFRDGTVWNYYDVPKEKWNQFHALHSKGLYIKNVLDGYDYGPASLTLIEQQDIRQEFYINRVNQQVSGGLGNWQPKRAAKIPRANLGRNPARSSNKGRQGPKAK
jgi:hypothetical protein